MFIWLKISSQVGLDCLSLIEILVISWEGRGWNLSVSLPLRNRKCKENYTMPQIKSKRDIPKLGIAQSFCLPPFSTPK